MNSGSNARRISVAAMMVALSLIVSLFPSLPGPVTKFGGLPLLIGGLLVGPRTGLAMGCLTDLIGFALRPTGPFFPGFTLSQGLTAMLPGLICLGRDPLTWRRLTESKEKAAPSRKPRLYGAYFRILGIFAMTQLLTSVLLVSFFTSKFVAGTPLTLELANRSLAQLFHVPVYAFIALTLLKTLSQSDIYERLLASRK